MYFDVLYSFDFSFCHFSAFCTNLTPDPKLWYCDVIKILTKLLVIFWKYFETSKKISYYENYYFYYSSARDHLAGKGRVVWDNWDNWNSKCLDVKSPNWLFFEATHFSDYQWSCWSPWPQANSKVKTSSASLPWTMPLCEDCHDT